MPYMQAANISHSHLDDATIEALEQIEPCAWVEVTDGDASAPYTIDLDEQLTNDELLARIASGELDGYYIVASEDVDSNMLQQLRQLDAEESAGYWTGDHTFWIG